MKAQDIAEYFLTLVNEEVGDSMSNLKLQKLVYYAQGCHLALFGKPLIDEEIQAWEHGPVVPALYRKFKQHGAEPIPAPKKGIDGTKYPKRVRELLDEVFQVYGQYSASKLRNLTHAEPPWKEAYDVSPSAVISHESMKTYFKTQLNG